MSVSAEVDVSVVYGMGGACAGRFPRHSVEGLAARDLVQQVIQRPQPAGPAARTAQVLAEVLRSRREIDAELTDGPDEATGRGQPITLDQVVVRGRSDAPQSPERDDVTIRISESYRGGLPCPTGASEDGEW
jgi:hypothetical protein